MASVTPANLLRNIASSNVERLSDVETKGLLSVADLLDLCSRILSDVANGKASPWSVALALNVLDDTDS